MLSSGQAHALLDGIAREADYHSGRCVDKPLILYGAGELGNMAKGYFQRMKIPFQYVIDRNPGQYRGDSRWADLSIFAPEEAPAEDRSRCLLAVCIVTAPYARIVEFLRQLGWEDIVPFYDITEAYVQECPIGNGWYSGPFEPLDRDETGYVLDHWNDDISRAHYLQFVAWHALRCELDFEYAPVNIGNRYFIPEIVPLLSDRETFVDGGAYHGDVTSRFINQVRKSFRKIYTVEPDPENIHGLRQNLKKFSQSGMDIEIVEAALGSLAGLGGFSHGMDYASQLNPASRETVAVCRLDDLDIAPTFVKLHLEGWEFDALRGGMNMLFKYRPILTITTYHKRNGLWSLPSFLMRQLESYLFLFRLHGWMGTGSVLYAIPRERFMTP